jgi:conjugation transfer TcpE-like protein
VELPTYTNIWKIEKRLYKLYDFRLPMPLPVGQIAAFLAIAVPYTLILTMVGMPFSHTWLWVYILPPGVLAWLVTRPVLEGKRLPELVHSQLRYLSEPKTWCRLAPLTEKDDVVLTARVWRSAHYARPAERPAVGSGGSSPRASKAREADGRPAFSWSAAAEPWPVAPRRPAALDIAPAQPGPAWPSAPSRSETRRLGPDAPHRRPAGPEAEPQRTLQRGRGVDPAPASGPRPSPSADVPADSLAEATAQAAASVAAPAERPPTAVPPAAPPRRPAVRVTADGGATRPLNVVERALRNSPGAVSPGAGGFRDPVVVVPGGHRPGKPDHVQRDRARVTLALPGPARTVVLGCTAGAGQTITTLLSGQLLASLRGEAVAVVDLSRGPTSLTEQARFVPALMSSRRVGADSGTVGRPGERGLQVVTAADSADDPGRIISAVAARYPLTLADPEASRVPWALRAADQLILVAPASAEAASSLAMTFEWLQAHDFGALAANAIVVLNGVSSQTAGHADKTAAVASGRSRAIVRVPWDERMGGREPLATATIHAYIALAGVLVAALADGGAKDGAAADAKAADGTATGARR